MEILAYQALERCLAEVSFARLEPIAPSPDCDYDIDMLMNLRLPAGEKRLMIEVKSSGEPRHVREAINQLYRYRESCPEAYGIIITPYVSPRSAGICAAEGVGYVDLAGNCRLEFDQVYIRREGYPNTFAEKRPLRSLYMPKAERILRVMLTYPGRHWKVQEMANEADVSLGQVAKVKALLMDKEWIKVDSEGFCLCDPPALLVEWAENYHFRRSKIYEFYSLQQVGETESGIGEVAGCEFSGEFRDTPLIDFGINSVSASATAVYSYLLTYACRDDTDREDWNHVEQSQRSNQHRAARVPTFCRQRQFCR